MREINFTELEAEHTELLPTRETLTVGFGNNNWAAIVRDQLVAGTQRSVDRSAGQQRSRPDDRRRAGLISSRVAPDRGGHASTAELRRKGGERNDPTGGFYR